MNTAFEKPHHPIREIFQFLFEFAKAPIQKIKTLPQFDWPQILIYQVMIASVSGVLSGILSGSILSTIGNFFLYPISSLILHTASGALLTFFLIKHFHAGARFQRIYFLIVVANTPAFALRILTGMGIPIAPIGLGISAILISVGLVESLNIPKVTVLKWASLTYLSFVIAWLIYAISINSKDYQREEIHPPHSVSEAIEK